MNTMCILVKLVFIYFIFSNCCFHVGFLPLFNMYHNYPYIALIVNTKEGVFVTIKEKIIKPSYEKFNLFL